MLSWTATAIIFGTLSVCGATIDRFMLKRQKVRLYDALIALWCRVDDLSIRDLPRIAASKALRVLRRIFLGEGSWGLGILRTLLVSVVLTSAVYVASGLLFDRLGKFPYWFPNPLFFAVNYIYDLGTIAITGWALREVSKGGFWRSLLACGIDGASAVLLGVLCLASLSYSSALAQRWDIFPGVSSDDWEAELVLIEGVDIQMREDGFSDAAEIHVYSTDSFAGRLANAPLVFKTILGSPSPLRVVYTVRVEEGKKVKSYTVVFDAGMYEQIPLTALTTILPTVFYMFIILLLLLGKGILRACRVAVRQLLEALTDVDPKQDPTRFAPGTMTGMLFGTLGALLKVAGELAKTMG